MTLSVRAFWLPKKGNSIEEYEDAFDYSITDHRFAIADGATESSFAGEWARSLVHGVVASLPSQSLPSAEELLKFLKPLQQAWPVPGVLIEEPGGHIECGTTPYLHGPEARLIHLLGNGLHVFHPHSGGQGRLVAIAKSRVRYLQRLSLNLIHLSPISNLCEEQPVVLRRVAIF